MIQLIMKIPFFEEGMPLNYVGDGSHETRDCYAVRWVGGYMNVYKRAIKSADSPGSHYEQYPYATKDERALNNYLKAMLAECKRAKIQCEVERDHFGSGYASYI